MDKFIIGSHQSFTKGFNGLYKSMKEQNGNTFQFFMRNPRGSKRKEFDREDADKLIENMQGEVPIMLVHAPYTLNPCSDKDYVKEFARDVLREDIERLEYFGKHLYNFHPGSHLGQGTEVGINIISDLLNEILHEDMHTTVLLETMAGKGTEIGRNFEELAMIIERVNLKDKLGICMDTCHIHEGGYDIVNDLDGVLEEFDKIIGLERLKAIHLNDSKNPIGAHKDRHEEIGKGHIGLEAIRRIINHEKLRALPFYLETPLDNEGHKIEIELLRSMRE
ncbi:deoxyribonuclease IV [Peptoniphilus indolicus]|uniref:Probable endonuclease 4 n=2 Tax=Peptoniphilus indolicus TaxID=33030 RepID=G4D2E0_9FIRM|nr:deoxyribonuclease IV [Peptoniphilus indolicus]EGY80311.1 deoxyribonuclease IV (phage-T(4)-induced) [Peptoniphilus indolicus ATCC 29427]SUB75348.1 Probable endonuclease 4 [Peptoniphilus indolicus]